MSTGPGVSFADLFAYEEEDANHWEEWFRANAPALSARVELKHTLRNKLFHIFSVAQRNAERLLGEEMTPDRALEARTLEQLFRYWAIGAQEVSRVSRERHRRAACDSADIRQQHDGRVHRNAAQAAAPWRDPQHPPLGADRNSVAPAGIRSWFPARRDLQQSD